jgi:hypothetical protein
MRIAVHVSMAMPLKNLLPTSVAVENSNGLS